MINDELKASLDEIILENLEIYVLKDYPYDRENYYGSLPSKLSIGDYELCSDPIDIDPRALSFIEKATVDARFYSLNITNFQGPYAIKNLTNTIFTCLKDHIDLDLIVEFHLIKSNIIGNISQDLFQPVDYSLQRLSFYESYLQNIPEGLFKKLDLDSLEVEYSVFHNSVPDFGLKLIDSIKKMFIFKDNRIGNLKQLKLKDTVKNYKTKKLVIEY